jgi:hypothetical protein
MNYTSSSTFSRLVSVYQKSENTRFVEDELITKRFVFGCLRDLGVKLNLEQLEKMMELLTPEQLKTINERLDKEDGGYSTWF